MFCDYIDWNSNYRIPQGANKTTKKVACYSITSRGR